MGDAVLEPIQKAYWHNRNVLAGVNFLPTDLTPSKPPGLFRVMISVTPDTRFSAVITYAGATVTVHFNQGADIVADCLYIFDLLVLSTAESINFLVNDNITINIFNVQEISAGTQ